MTRGPVSDELYNALVRAQAHTHVALNLCNKEDAPVMLREVLARALTSMTQWQVRLAREGNQPQTPVDQ